MQSNWFALHAKSKEQEHFLKACDRYANCYLLAPFLRASLAQHSEGLLVTRTNVLRYVMLRTNKTRANGLIGAKHHVAKQDKVSPSGNGGPYHSTRPYHGIA